MMRRSFKVIIMQDEDGTFITKVPELPGCLSEGKTKKEALKNISEAIEGYMESVQAEGWPSLKVVGEKTVTVDVKV